MKTIYSLLLIFLFSPGYAKELSSSNLPSAIDIENLISFPSDTTPEDNSAYPSKKPISLITGNGRRTSFKLRYGMFWSGLTLKNTVNNVTYPDFELGGSYHWFGEFDILLQTRLGRSNSGPWSIYYGVGWDNRKFQQGKDALQLASDADEKAIFITPQHGITNIEEAELHLSYIRIPIGLQYKLRSFAVNAGGYFGFNTKHKQALEYTTSNDEEAELILDKNYNFNKTIYGLSTSIGFKRIHLAFNYDLSTLFEDNDDYEYNAWKIGLMIF